MILKEYPLELQPREKAIRYGIKSLSETELLALILQSGCHQLDVLEVSKNLLINHGGLKNLSKSNLFELYSPGIKKAKGLKLMAVFEIANRLNQIDSPSDLKFLDSYTIYRYFGRNISNLNFESLVIVLLDKLKRLICFKRITSSLESKYETRINDILKYAISNNASYLYLLHNHPSNNMKPSLQDKKSTLLLEDSLNMIGLTLLEHLIVTSKGYYEILANKENILS